MKKIAIALIFALVCSVLCSCGHTHTEGKWSANQEMHWRVCEECGELMEMSMHAFGEHTTCVVCGADTDGHIHTEGDGHTH